MNNGLYDEHNDIALVDILSCRQRCQRYIYVTNAISACCTTSGIEPNIVPGISITQIIQIHFRYISTSGFSKLTQIQARTSYCCIFKLLSIDIGQHMSKHLFFHSVIWYLAYTYSDRFQTFTIGKICFSQGDLSINSVWFG